MKDILYYILLIFLLCFLVVGLWMNATAGYFQRECCGCGVDYLSENYQHAVCPYLYCKEEYCEVSLVSKLKLKLAEFDFAR